MAQYDIKAVRENSGGFYDEILLNKVFRVSHGVETIGTITADNTEHTITLSAINYWWKGVNYSIGTNVVVDLDLTTDRDNSSNTLATNTLYYIYFKDASGKLYWSDTAWSWYEHTFVCTAYWNGSAFAVQHEYHGYRRNIDWQIWAHDTIGVRLEGTSGFGITTPSVGTPGAIDIATGTAHDEDLDFTTGQQTSMRGWRLASASKYTFADYSTPYLGTAGQPQFLNVSAPYALANVTAAKYTNYWVYVANDKAKHIYVVCDTAEYNTIALARAVNPPSLSTMGFNADIKILYRWIFKGDGAFEETTDYRSSAPVASGGTTTITAGNVTFSPVGSISATSVQSALEEVDSEKLAITSKASSSEINTGTEDTKYVTSKGITDSNIAFVADIPVKATGAELNTGTDDAKFATAKALDDGEFIGIHVGTSAPADTTKLWLDTN